jgi:hypothetical protein
MVDTAPIMAADSVAGYIQSLLDGIASHTPPTRYIGIPESRPLRILGQTKQENEAGRVAAYCSPTNDCKLQGATLELRGRLRQSLGGTDMSSR